jgi:hypothetical protein
MGLLQIAYDEPDRTGAWGIEVEGGAMVGALWPHEGTWRWELFDLESAGVAFDCGEAPTMAEAQVQVRDAANERVASTIEAV